MKSIKASSIIAAMRGHLYGKGMRRTPLFKAITAVLAAEMAFMGLAPAVIAANLPQMSGGYGAGMDVKGQTLTIDGAAGAGSSFTWDQGFNIGQGYTVQFQNIGTAVNKDTSGALSSILGNLFSSGAVYILNPNGILFGSSAVVDVHGLIAAAVGSVSKGPDGEFVFSKLGSGDVVNQGSISAGNFAYLVGRSVENSGSISANDVALAAFGGTGADSLTIASAENGAKITFNIPEGVVSEDESDGENQDGTVTVSGTITGVQDEQPQNGAGRSFASTPSDVGTPNAEGNISVAAAHIKVEEDISAKNVTLNGTKYVNIGTADGSANGSVTATEGDIELTSAGNVNVWGNLQADNGNITLTASGAGKSVKIGNGTDNVSITAGGAVTITGDKSAQLLSGTVASGGTVTMSGKEYVAVNGDITGTSVELTTTEATELSSAVGGYSAGDPAGILQFSGTIAATAGDVTIDSNGSAALNGTIRAAADGATGGNVSIVARDAVNGGIQNNAAVTADGGVVLDAKTVTGTGDISADDLGITVESFNQDTSVSTIAINATGTGGSIVVNNDKALTIGSVNGIDGLTTADGSISVTAAGDITVDKAVQATGGDVTLDASANSISILANTSGGNIILSSNTTVGDGTTTANLTATAATGSINATGKTLTQNGGEISADSLTASKFVQQNDGTLKANVITADIEQKGCTIVDNGDGTITVTGDITQEDGLIGGAGVTKITIDGALNQNANAAAADTAVIQAGELVLTANATQGGELAGDTIKATTLTLSNAGAIDLQSEANEIQKVSGTAASVDLKTTTALEVNGLATAGGNTTLDAGANLVTFKGANSAADYTLKSKAKIDSGTTEATTKVDAKTAGKEIEVATGASLTAPTVEAAKLTTAGTVTATTIDGEVVQSAGEIRETASATGLTLKNGAVTQNGGKVTAATLALDNEANDVVLISDANEIDNIGGIAKSIRLHDSKALNVTGLTGKDGGVAIVAKSVNVTGEVKAEGIGDTANVLINANGADDTDGVTLNADVTAAKNVSVIADNGQISQNANITAQNGTVDVDAAGELNMQAGKKTEATGNILYKGDGGTVNGELKATGSGSQAQVVASAIGGGTSIVADEIKLDVSHLGTAEEHVQLNASKIAINATTGGIYIDNAKATEIVKVDATAVDGFKVNRVKEDLTTEEHGLQAGTGELNGLSAERGDIVLNNTGTITVNADVKAKNVTLTSNVDNTTTPPVDVADIIVNGSKVQATGGNVMLDAASAVTIQSATAGGTTTRSQVIATGDVDIDADSAVTIDNSTVTADKKVLVGAANDKSGSLTVQNGAAVTGKEGVEAYVSGNAIVNNATVKAGKFTWDPASTEAPAIANDDIANMAIDAGGDIVVQGNAAVGASGTLGLMAAGDNGIEINASKVASKGNMTIAATKLDAGSVSVQNGYVGTKGKLDINAAKDVTIDPSTVESEDDIDIDATAGDVVIEASKVASSKTITIGKDANVGGDITIRADASDMRSLVMAKTGLAANANGNITIDKSTVVSGIVDDGTDTVDPYVSDATADMALNAAKAVAVQGGARVGAANALDIASGAEGVSIDGTGTKAVAKNGDMTIYANNGAVTVSGGAYVGGNGAIDIGKTTGNTTSLTVKDASQLVAAGNVSAKISEAIAVQDTAKVGSDAQVAMEATGDNATITVADSALVIAKDKVELKAANGTVALTDTAKVRVTGGAAAQDPALVLNGGKGVTASASTTIDATGANLDVDAKTGAIALNGKILAKDADFTAKEGTTGQAITADNANNDFTGTVTADGASAKIIDANDISLGNVTANGNATTGNALVETVKGSITVLENATVKSEKANVTLTASTDASATEGDIVVNGKVIAAKTATLTAEKGSITDKASEIVGHDTTDVAANPFATGTRTTHVKGNNVELTAQSIGAAGTPLDIEAGTVTANATAGSVYLFEEDDVTVNEISAAQNAKIETAAGAITIDATGAGITANEGDILVAANGGAISQNAAITARKGTTADKGNISVIATGAIAQNATIAADGTVDVESTGNGITIADKDASNNDVVTTAGGNIRYKAATTLENNGTIKTTGVGKQVVLDAPTLSGSGNVEAPETTSGLVLIAEKIGDALSFFKTKVSKIAAQAENGIWIENEGDVEISTATVGDDVKVNRISLDSSTTSINLGLTDDGNGGQVALSGMKTSANGPVELKTKVDAQGKGTITVDANVEAKGANGNVILTANGENNKVIVNANKTVDAAQNATITAAGKNGAAEISGTVQAEGLAKVEATGDNGDVKVNSGAQVLGKGGVTLTAAKDVTVDGAKVKAGTFNETTGVISGNPADLIVTADGKVAVQGAAQVGASGKAEVTAKGAGADGGVTVDGSGTKLAANKGLSVKATGDGADVTVSGGAYVAARNADNGDATTLTAEKGAVTVTGDGTKVEAGKNLTITAANNATVEQSAKVGADGQLTVKATGDDGSVIVQSQAQAFGKDGVTLTSVKKNVTVDNALVKAGTFTVVDETTGEVTGLDGSKTLKIEAANGQVALKGGAKLGASGEVDVDAGTGGVLIDNAKLVAVGNNAMDIKATKGKVDIKNGAYVGGNGTLAITTTAASENLADQVQHVTVNGSTIESVGNLTVTAGGDVITDASSRIGTDGNLTISATGATGIDADGLLIADRNGKTTTLTANNGAIDAHNANNDIRTVVATANGNISIVDKDDLVVSKVNSDTGNAVVETGAKMTIQDNGVTAAQNATLVAGGAIDQNANITATAGDAWVEAQGGSVTMKDDAAVKTVAGGNAYVAATGDSGDVSLSLVEVTGTGDGKGYASIYSKNGSIKDNLTAETANVTAQKVRLEAKNDIGRANDDDIETTADNIEILAGTDAFVHNTKAVTVGGVDGVTVKKVATATAVAASSANNAGGDLTGAEATAGNLSILADGQMTVAANEAVEAGANAVLETTVDGIELNAGVTAGQNATILAKTAVDQNADITATADDAYVEAQGGNVTMADGTKTEATAGNARVAASGSVKLSSVKAENGNVSVVATAGDITDNTAAETANITAKALRIEAGKAIGGANAANIDTSVDNIEILAGTDAFVHNTKAVTVGEVNGVTVQKVVTAYATTVDVTDADLNNGQTGAKATAGNLSVLADGQMTVNEAVNAGANAVLQTTAGGIELNAGVTAGQNATILAKTSIDQNADITTTAGDAYVEAEGGNVTMKDGTKTEATTGNARVAASGNVALSSVKAARGNASIKSGGSITDNTAAEAANITAKNLRIEAGKSIGGANAGNIDTSVSKIELLAKNGNAFVRNDKALTVGGVNGVTVKKVNVADGAAAAAPADSNLTGAKATAGDIRLVANGNLTGAEAIVAKGDMRLESETGAVALNDTVTAGKNLTIASKKAMTTAANKAIKAGEDLYVNAGGDINIKGGATANDKNGVMALVSGGKIDANSVKAGTFYANAKGNVNPGKLAANNMALNTEGDFKTTLLKNTELAVSAGGSVTIDANGKTLTAGGSSAAGGKQLTVTEVLAAAPPPAEIELKGTGKGRGAIGGITAENNVTVTDAANVDGTTIVAKKGDVEIGTTGDYSVDATKATKGNVTLNVDGDLDAKAIEAGGDAYIDVDGSLKAGSVAAGGLANLDVDGSIDAGTISGNPVEVSAGGSFKANIIEGGNVTINKADSVIADSVSGGDINVTSSGSVEFGSVEGSGVTVGAGGGIKTTGEGIKSSDLTLKGGDIDVTLDSQKITLIEGNNVKITEKANDRNVSLDTINAKGDLELTAANIGGAHGEHGYVDANDSATPGTRKGKLNLISGGNMTLDIAGKIGKASNPMEIEVGKELKLKSGNLQGSNLDNPGEDGLTPISYFYLISEGQQRNWNTIWDAYYGKGQIPGLVTYNGQVYAASPTLWLQINRALAFTIDTPELKSKQGVFGTPLFVHTDMDVSEAASIGTVDYVSIAETVMDTLADPDVNDHLIDLVEEDNDPDLKRRFDLQRKNPLGRDALYSKEIKGKDKATVDKEKADRAAAKAKAKAEKAAAAEKAKAEREAKRKADKAAAEKTKAEKAKDKAPAKAEAKADVAKK